MRWQIRWGREVVEERVREEKFIASKLLTILILLKNKHCLEFNLMEEGGGYVWGV